MYMELEKQVCSLELAKCLKELGVKQESYFFWWVDRYGNSSDNNAHVQDHEPNNPKEGWRVVSAFTVAELGEMLPPYFGTHKRDTVGDWICYDNNFEKKTEEVGRAETEADARAKMLIYLLENNLLSSNERTAPSQIK